MSEVKQRDARSLLTRQWDMYLAKAEESRKRPRSSSRSPPRVVRGPPPTPMKKKQRVAPRDEYLVGGVPPTYVARERIGAGSLGEVWSIETKDSETRWAVKYSTHPSRAASLRATWTDAMRLLHEVPEHKNVARVTHAWISSDEVLFSIMERGTESLAHRLERKGDVDLVALERDLRAGLAHLHKHNVLHTDIQPGNIVWFEADKCWKLVDMDQCAPADEPNDRDSDQRYMAPSMLETGATIDTDLFAVAKVLEEAGKKV